MIAVDTNVLVRFLVADNETQAACATASFEAAARRRVTIFVSQIVVCELVWVLSIAYRRDRFEITSMLELLLRSGGLELEGRDEVTRALNAFAAGKGDFADYLIREKARSAGCESVMTFDSALLREAEFVRPSAKAVSG